MEGDDFDESVHGELIREFRSRLGNNVRAEHDDRALFKWLKARKYDVKAAEKMYLKNLAWRRQIGADSILTDFVEPEVIRKYYPGGLCGYSREGLPVWIEPMGLGDLRGILSSLSKDEVVKCMVYRLEALYARFRQLSEERQKPIDKCLHIIDVSGFGVRHLWKPVLDTYVAVLRMLEDNYPETLRASYIINAPKVFRMGFDFLKTFIDPQTANKLFMLGNDHQQILLSLIDADELPVAFGGTKVDDNGDPMCSQWICCGGEVPKYFYSAHNASAFPDGQQVTVKSVGQRRTLAVDVDISQPHSLLRWFIFVSSGSIELTVKRRSSTGNGAVEVVRPTASIDCGSASVVDGSVTCDVSGKYTLEFYNSSLLWSRSITYSVEVTEPSGDVLVHAKETRAVDGSTVKAKNSDGVALDSTSF